ncbi:hypothetical protein T439DRAFT_333933 [Meredithblackwellia eburnea MCA 4105]
MDITCSCGQLSLSIVSQVPTELLIEIIKATLPPPSLATHCDRNQQLVTFCQVCKDWNEFVWPILWEQVVFSPVSVVSTDAFTVAMGGTRLGDCVKVVGITGKSPEATGFIISTLHSHCSNLESLWLDKIVVIDLSVLQPIAQNLVRLELGSVVMIVDSPIVFPKLRSLASRGAVLERGTELFFRPSTFPSLRNLHTLSFLTKKLDSDTADIFDYVRGFGKTDATLNNQIVSLFDAGSTYRLLETGGNNFPSLEILDLMTIPGNQLQSPAELGARIPTTLRFIFCRRPSLANGFNSGSKTLPTPFFNSETGEKLALKLAFFDEYHAVYLSSELELHWAWIEELFDTHKEELTYSSERDDKSCTFCYIFHHLCAQIDRLLSI